MRVVLMLCVLLCAAHGGAQDRARTEDTERVPTKEEIQEGADPVGLAGGGKTAMVEGYDLNGEAMRRFTGPAWSLVFPDRDFQGGCVIGFLSFRFSPTGYFVYNNRMRGSWRVDEMGNLLLRTKEGLKFTLIVEGTTLRPVENLPFARKFYQFQRCPA
jgi:hypothetical protein